MGGMIPLNDSSRRPVHFPVVTVCIIITNFVVFGLELKGGDAFVLKWSAVAANITAGHGWITILTAMFMHGSWLHILGNMVFLWAFGPEIEDAMNPVAVFVLLSCRRDSGHAGANRGQPQFYDSQSRCERRNCRCDGRIYRDLPTRSDSRAPDYFCVRPCHHDPRGVTHWVLVSDSAVQRRVGCKCTNWRSSLLGSRRRVCVRRSLPRDSSKTGTGSPAR